MVDSVAADMANPVSSWGYMGQCAVPGTATEGLVRYFKTSDKRLRWPDCLGNGRFGCHDQRSGERFILV